MKMTDNEIHRKRKEFFNNHAERWRDMWYRDGASGNYDKHKGDFERLFSIIPLSPGDCVLDVGCGTGILVPYILGRIFDTGMLYELDYAEQMIAVNRGLHSAGNIRFIVADVEAAPIDSSSCDLVICFSCFPHFHDKKKALSTLYRILKQGGAIVIAHFASSEGINKHHSSCRAVMHDHLPEQPAMRSLLEETGFAVHEFIDEPEFYCIVARK